VGILTGSLLAGLGGGWILWNASLAEKERP